MINEIKKNILDIINNIFIRKKNFYVLLLICFIIIYFIDVYTNIRRTKIIDPVKITINTNNTHDIEKIKLIRIAPRVGEFYIEKNSENTWEDKKSYFKKIRISFPENTLSKIQKITINIGKNEFNYTNEEIIKKWIKIDNKSKIINTKEKYIIYDSPPDLKTNKSLLPICSRIINWPGDFKILFYSFNLNLIGYFLFTLIIILFFFIFIELLNCKHKNNNYSDKITRKEKITISILISTFFSSVFFFSSAQIYFLNIDEFNCTFLRLIPFLSIALLLSIIIISLLAMFIFKLKIYQELLSLIFILAFLFWLQGNIFIWKYGIFDGSDIQWNKFFLNGLFDSFIWIFFILFSLFYSHIVYKYIKSISIFFLLLQICLFSYYIIKAPEAPGSKKYSIDKSTLFNFSPEKNVIILTLDEFQSDIFNEIINEDDYYRNIFNNFIYFPNSLSAYSNTAGSVPTLLTGAYYDNTIPKQQFIKTQFLKNSLPKFMLDKGFRVDVHPQNSSNILFDKKVLSNIIPKTNMEALIDQFYLYDLVLFRSIPHFFKKFVYNNERWFIRRIILKINYIFNTNRFKILKSEQLFKKESLMVSEDLRFINDMLEESNLNSKKKTFKYYHINGTHPTFVIDENFEPKRMIYNRNNFKKQAKACLKVVKLFLEKLKELGIYDKSLIFIISDHGSGRTPDMYIYYNKKPDLSNKELEHFKARGLALMLVKPINSIGNFKYNDKPVSLTDISKTVASQLNYEPLFNGYSMLDNTIPFNRKRLFYTSYNTEYTVIGDSRDNTSWHITNKN